MSRVYRVDSRIWDSAEFRNLTPVAPGGQALWLYLLCANQLATIPGVYSFSCVDLAERLGWGKDDVALAMIELTQEGLAWADWSKKLVWSPKIVGMNRPDNPNMAKAWVRSLAQLPRCELSNTVRDWVLAYLSNLGEGFERAVRDCQESVEPQS